jgi:hypothetical protein
MRCSQLEYIVLQRQPVVSLEQLILAIVMQRRVRGRAEVVVSRAPRWADIGPARLPKPSNIAIPQFLIDSLHEAQNEFDLAFVSRLNSAEHLVMDYEQGEKEVVLDIASDLLDIQRQILGEKSNSLLLCPDIAAICCAIIPAPDPYLEQLLTESIYLFEPEHWGEALTVLKKELKNQARSDEQWTGLVNRFALG